MVRNLYCQNDTGIFLGLKCESTVDMVKKWRKCFGKIRKAASQYKKDLKQEITSWRRTVFNIVVQIVIHVLRKSQGTSRPLLRSSLRRGDNILSFPLVGAARSF